MRLPTLLLVLLPLLGALHCARPVPAAARLPEDAAPTLPAAARRRVLDAPLWTRTLAVLDTRIQVLAPDNYHEDLTAQVTERIEAAFCQTGRFEPVERARLDTVRRELMLTSDALCFDQGTVARMGRMLGAKALVLPTGRLEVGLFGTRLDLLVKVLDTETASVVQTFEVRTASCSLSLNSSITACLDRLRGELADTLRPVYPAQAVIVHSPRPGLYWAEARQAHGFRAGDKVRFLQNQEVFNPITKTMAPFTAEAGRGRVQSVESFGLVIKARDVPAEEGWLVEALP